MADDYSVDICRQLEQKFNDEKLHRPMRVSHYDVGTELVYHAQEVGSGKEGNVQLETVKFVGGGFAGQVYQVKIRSIDTEDGKLGGLEENGLYAMKILIPPSGFSLIFRNVLYWVGFQGSFQLQANPTAARAGALWQKFIRRGAKIYFGSEQSVVDIHATFVDNGLGSCGELSEWVDGRTWRLEVDDHLDALKYWRKGMPVDDAHLGSPEYRSKYEFMHKFVALLRDMGGHEFARQYEWSTCKSQPNCLKRNDAADDPEKGLVAVDFRAGLALLPFLPMSPGDFKLIFSGLRRGSLVQFDRGDLNKLDQFVHAHADAFSDMLEMLEELKACEETYRNSVPDITHNHIRLFYSRKLWSTMLGSTVTGWKVKNIVDEPRAEKFGSSRIRTLLFILIGLIPFLGSFVRRIWGRADWRKHYKGIWTSWRYFKQAFRARMAEKMISWHRDGRVDDTHAMALAGSVWRFLPHLPLSILPAGLHKLLTDWRYARERFDHLFIRPVRLYFNTELREEWLREMVADGQKKHILSNEDADTILSRIKEPFIQKYLKSLAVHVCTLPVTQVVSVVVAGLYVAMHPEMSRAEAWGYGLGIIALFQVVPISPGSLVRGLYVLYLVIKERNFKDYNIAVFLGFFKYIGYLAFPIQMAYRYPVLARFMAAHWANESVHIVPVFGESGALLEHWVYCLFYNWPLTLKRRIGKRAEERKAIKTRYWHLVLCILVSTGIFGAADMIYVQNSGAIPGLREIWWLSILVPLGCGALVTWGFGGAGLGNRIAGAAFCGVMIAVLSTTASVLLTPGSGLTVNDLAVNCVWRIFLFSIFSTLGAIITELKLPDPALKGHA